MLVIFCSIKSPVLVNRGWVPRSWRDKFVKTKEDIEQPPSPSSAEKKQPKKHWWSFRSKMPELVEVVLSNSPLQRNHARQFF